MKRLLFGLAMLCLGVIMGAAVTNVVIGKQIDVLYFNNIELKQQLAATEKELLQWRNNQSKQQRVVTKIETKVDFSGNSDLSQYEKGSVELAVDKKVKEWLQAMLGQPIETLNYILVPTIIDGRELEVEGTMIQLKVNLVVISEHVVVHLKVITIKHPDKAVVDRA